MFNLRFQIHKDNSYKTLCVPLNSSVRSIKSLLCLKKDIDAEECEILFCGQAMQNDKHLTDYNVGSETILHVISRPVFTDFDLFLQRNATMSVNRNQFLTGIWLHRKYTWFTYNMDSRIIRNYQGHSEHANTHPQFFVYCKEHCHGVRPGKLRVRCSACKQDSIVLRREPGIWTDVLESGAISGTCFFEECEGDIQDVEFYFKCSCYINHGISGNNDMSVPLPNVRRNTENMICMTCFDIVNPVVTFPCATHHVLCMECFKQFARGKLHERQMVLDKNIGYTIECPEKCTGSLLTDVHLFHILGVDEYQNYQTFATEECLLQQMKGLICPNPKCGAGLYLDIPQSSKQNIEIKCTSCGFTFCSSCKESYHGDTKCIYGLSKTRTSSVEVSNYIETVKTIKRISRCCPECNVPTERSGGCMHMTCTRCRYEWCWNCHSKWNLICQSNHWFMEL